MSTALLEPPKTFWRCPSCGGSARGDADQLHSCPTAEGLLLPYAPVVHPDDVPDARHVMNGRQDYAGKFLSRRPMSCTTEYGDGHTDCTVFAHPVKISLATFAQAGVGAIGQVAAVASEMLGGHIWADEDLHKAAMMGMGLDMAWSASGVFSIAVLDMVTQVTSHTMKLGSDGFKCSLWNNNITPDKTVNLASSQYGGGVWISANGEVFSAGQWAQGGVALSTMTCTQASNIVTFSAATTSSGSTATLANVFGCMNYDTTLGTTDGLCFNYFGGTNSVTSGTFSVTWPNGIVQFVS